MAPAHDKGASKKNHLWLPVLLKPLGFEGKTP
jgi:hypothetical protein